MERSKIPFNISILQLTPDRLEKLRPVKVLDIFDGSSSNFHEDGLFSVLTFGPVGDIRRSHRFSFIDVRVPIFHPIIFRTLVSLKRLYAGILAGTEYVLWNDEINDFVASNAMEGKTGYDYFVKHWEKIKFSDSVSSRREQKTMLIAKYKNRAMTDKIVVIPAGLRDVEVGDDGRPRMDEINNIYSNLIKVSNTISEAAVKNHPEIINLSRWRLQNAFNELYDLLESMIEGKKKLYMSGWASRGIFNGTRNVITAMDTSTSFLGSPGSIKFNNTVVGLFQLMKAILPVSKYLIKNGFLSKVFTSSDAPAKLVNKKTLKSEDVVLPPIYFDRWATDKGIEKVIDSFGDEGLRNKPLEIAGRYVGLIYKGPDGTFRLMQDIDELPVDRDKADVHPLTFCELLYLSGYLNWNRYPLFVTRYPVTGVGSIYPSLVYVKTTVKSEVRKELSENWTEMTEAHTAYAFPTSGAYVNSLVPHSTKLGRLGADFDGDTASGNCTYTEESIAEVNELLGMRRLYVGSDGEFISKTSVDTVNLVMHNLTGW